MPIIIPDRSVNIYQIYHKPELKVHLDPAFIPFDHCDFTAQNPELSAAWREWPILRNFGLQRAQEDNAEVWGFVSYKWAEKTQVPGQKFVDFIRANPDNDVWFMEPRYMPFNPFVNSWIQGDMFHPGISKIVNSVMSINGHKANFRHIPMPLCYYNFFAGTEKFWSTFLSIIDKLIDTCQKDEALNKLVFETSANHGNDASVPYFIFLVERMFPTVITLSGLNYLGLKYHTNDFLVDPKNCIEVVDSYIK